MEQMLLYQEKWTSERKLYQELYQALSENVTDQKYDLNIEVVAQHVVPQINKEGECQHYANLPYFN